jgi:hypothetical protein
MALEHHLESLRKRHAQIEEILKQEESRPSPDSALIQQLKREKLLLRDEMSKADAVKIAA